MKAGWTISAALHAGVLLWGLVNIAAKPFDKAPSESLPVDIISATDFSQITKGTKTAPKAEVPKPLVEKVAEAKPVEDQNSKIVDNKPEITATSERPPEPPKPPEPEVKKVEQKPVPKPQPRPETKQAFAKEPEQKIDPIAEAIKKDTKKPEQKTQQKSETQQQKKAEPPKPQPKFDATKIAALIDKRDPQRQSITGTTLSNTRTLGTQTANAATLSQSEMDALRARLQQCWNPPVGLSEARDLSVEVRIRFNQDGTLSADPTVMNRGSHTMFQVAAESALRAVRSCAPYSFMPAAKYEAWKDVIVDFDPRNMFRG